ncbi:alpha/beta hydrolase [Peptoniphilus raoultii]|uniref:alpha/beta hydrolase n=1 Tax=Peptoniphilus raoultii TaxID=1776387 RepID=UPI0008DB33B1|nr:alpha/beta hydrolase [Peptoniphilus raoultii]
MSIVYKLLANILKLSNIKNIFTKDKDTILKYARKQNEKNKFNFEKIKKESKFSKCELIDFDGYPCIIFKENDNFSDAAILQLYGGGMITGPDKMDYKLADRLVKFTKRDVYFPLYPLCIDGSVIESYKLCFQVYKKILENYKPGQINVLGFSSGAALSLGIFLYNNDIEMPLPVPKKILAVSPGGLPNLESSEDREIMEKLEKLSNKDILIDAKYFKTAREILKNKDHVPEYMLNSLKGNFKNFPETHLYYGSEECLFAFAEYFCRVFEKYKVPYSLTVGKGMCHCYPLLRIFKEGREAQDKIIDLLK